MALMGAAGNPLQVSGGSTSATGNDTRLGPGSKSVTTAGAAIGTVTGGTTPYTYAWEYVSGDAFSITSPASATSTFSITITVGIGETVGKTGVYRCRATDAVGAFIYGPDCTVSASLTESS